jgi:hypothetical protein|tara:strand:+ start:236 stop:604 length:369 start_codon:yes stop_codon:yes gene_type:complete
MKLFETLDESTFLIFSAKNYYNPTCIDAEEFYEDIKRFKYIKRLLNRHLDGGKLSVNLILNHLIVVFNVFGNEPGLKMLEYKLDDRHWTSVKPFLVYLRVITNETYTGIEMDARVIEELRKI